MRKIIKGLFSVVLCTCLLAGCSSGGTKGSADDEVNLEILTVKGENIGTYKRLIEKFEQRNPNINVKLEAPPEAETVLRMRLTKNDTPDIIAFNGNPTYGEIAEVGVLHNFSDSELVDTVEPAYIDMLDRLVGPERDGVYGMPYATNANVVIYNKQKLEELDLAVPKTWDQFIDALEKAQEAGEIPIQFTLLETWTVLPAWNALAANLVPDNFGEKKDDGEASFAESHDEVAEKMLKLTEYGAGDIFGLGYDDGNNAFASGNGVFYMQINSAIPEILRINPDMELGVFPLPVNNDPTENKLVSGVDVALSVSDDSEHKEEALQFVEFMMSKEASQQYIEEQKAFSAIKGVQEEDSIYDGITDYFAEGRITNFQDHYYPIGLSSENIIQSFLIRQNKEVFLNKLDKEWEKVQNR